MDRDNLMEGIHLGVDMLVANIQEEDSLLVGTQLLEDSLVECNRVVDNHVRDILVGDMVEEGKPLVGGMVEEGMPLVGGMVEDGGSVQLQQHMQQN